MGAGQRWWSLPALAVCILTLLTLAAGPASAATEDYIESLVAEYTVHSDGAVDVVETIVLHFGSTPRGPGLDRWLLTRRPHDVASDRFYEVSDPVVTSPSGARLDLDVHRDEGAGRERWMRVRASRPGQPNPAQPVSYRLSYTMRAVLDEGASGPSFSWDVTGSRLAAVREAAITVRVPGDARDPACRVDPATSSNGCTTATLQGSRTMRFSAHNVPAGRSLVVSVRLDPRSVTGGGPVLRESQQRIERRQGTAALAISTAAALLVPLLAWWYVRRNGRDRRFVSLPPGELPADGAHCDEVRTGAVPVGLRDHPPELSLAEAGLLLTGQPDVRQTAATLVGLAVDGALKLRGGTEPEARLVDARRARDRPSALLLAELFDRGETVADLTANGVLAEGHDRIASWAADRAADEGWFVRLRTGPFAGTAIIALLGAAYLAYLLIGVASLYALPLLASLVIVGLVLQRRLRRGVRTGRGRALTDRVEGFRNWLAQIEADEVKVEPDEDVYSRYLPWAVLFGLTERWTRVCLDLVASGRISGARPTWSHGSTWTLSKVPSQIAGLNASITAAATAPDFSGSASSARRRRDA